MIRKLSVRKLNGRFDRDLEFYDDLNIFGGDIGTGKTTLLKLIWFLTSGNLQRVISEIPFQTISIETSQFSLSMEMSQDNPDQVKLVWKFTEEEKESEALLSLIRDSSESVILKQENEVRELNGQIAKVMQGSLFFPTFRRIERHFGWDILGEPLSQLAGELSVDDHKFITSISTYDLIKLLTEKDIEISEGTNRVDEEYKTLCERWSTLEQLVHDILEYPGGIQITDNLTLPRDSNNKDIISSANLSSGEKQLLGFLCYNAFSDAKTIFIDEPELSLNSHWRRLLLRVLVYQGTEKQFFVATHSIVHIPAFYPHKLHELPKFQGEN